MGGLGGEIDCCLNTVESGELLLHPGDARGARHPLHSQVNNSKDRFTHERGFRFGLTGADGLSGMTDVVRP